jgi:CheY-like chemotaxis protein
MNRFPCDFRTMGLVRVLRVLSVTNSSILHVEDEDSAAFLVQAALDQAAIPNRTYRVSSGEDALAYLCKTGPYKDAPSPSLVILDLNLPRVDGWTVLETMKGRSDLQRIPVVVLSSSRQEEDRERALRLGADDFVLKESTVAETRKAILNACAEFMSFSVLMESARTYVIKAPTIAFECSLDNGAEINIAMVLPEGAQVKLVATEPAKSAAHIRYGSRDLWMSLHDLRDHAIATVVTRPDSQVAPSP